MKKIGWRSRLAICCGKLTSTWIRRLHRGNGGTLPGYVARRIDPGILTVLSGMVGEGILVVMGTNGKTTTNRILCEALRAEGKKVLINETGANMLNGVISAFVLAVEKGGILKADYACIEVDENASVEILPKLGPDCVVLTNISRDQLDRFGEVDLTYETIKSAVQSVPGACLAVNGDDAFLGFLLAECENPRVVYGIEEEVFDVAARSEVLENAFCRFCGARLHYDLVHYGQLGLYRCPGCGFARPRPDYRAEDIAREEEGYSFTVEGRTEGIRTVSPYHVYNTLAAYGALRSVGISGERFAKALGSLDFGNNREGTFTIGRARVQLHLAKNPMGFQQKLSMIRSDSKPKDLLLFINDRAQDGRDISWLWDVDFQYLKEAGSVQIFTGGARRYDMGLRLKYEGIESQAVADIREALRRLTNKGTGNVYVVVNYSGLYPANHILEELMEEEKGGGHFEADHRSSVS